MRRFKREVLRRGPFIERVWAPSAMPALAAIALVLFFGTGIAVVVASWDFDRGARAVSAAAGSPASDRPATAPSSHGARAAPDRFRLLRAVAASARQQALVREPTVGGRGALPVAARTARVVAGTKAPVTRPPPRRSRPEPDARAAATPTPPAQPATPAPPPPTAATPQAPPVIPVATPPTPPVSAPAAGTPAQDAPGAAPAGTNSCDPRPDRGNGPPPRKPKPGRGNGKGRGHDKCGGGGDQADQDADGDH